VSSPSKPVELSVLPSCALDEQGLKEQRARYARLAASVTNAERRNDRLHFRFAEDFDRTTLTKAIAVERECCPFFEIAFDADTRELSVGVSDRRMLPALEAIEFALAASVGRTDARSA
jgi:hypothetical protein